MIVSRAEMEGWLRLGAAHPRVLEGGRRPPKRFLSWVGDLWTRPPKRLGKKLKSYKKKINEFFFIIIFNIK